MNSLQAIVLFVLVLAVAGVIKSEMGYSARIRSLEDRIAALKLRADKLKDCGHE